MKGDGASPGNASGELRPQAITARKKASTKRIKPNVVIRGELADISSAAPHYRSVWRLRGLLVVCASKRLRANARVGVTSLSWEAVRMCGVSPPARYVAIDLRNVAPPLWMGLGSPAAISESAESN
jgi:hypothetical protein